MRILAFSALFFLAHLSFGQVSNAVKPNDETATRIGATKAKPSVTGANASNSASWESWRDLSIPAGQSLTLDSSLDYSSFAALTFTFRSANKDAQNIAISTFWSVPDAGFMNSLDVVTGDVFYYSNTGGSPLSIGGTTLRLILTNTGTATMNLQSAFLYAYGK
ncbi:MAG: hypothetical protein M3Z09_15570 [Acidobacteriota bacterium]|nr:hypothetical protein [Acidobacteriota bacterium]